MSFNLSEPAFLRTWNGKQGTECMFVWYICVVDVVYPASPSSLLFPWAVRHVHRNDQGTT